MRTTWFVYINIVLACVGALITWCSFMYIPVSGFVLKFLYLFVGSAVGAVFVGLVLSYLDWEKVNYPPN